MYKVGRVPKTLAAIGERLEPRFGRLGREYQRVVFDKQVLGDDPTLEWVTPGHPLFEAVRSDVHDRVAQDLRRGALFWDLQTAVPYRLDVFSASIKDGRGNTLHRRLFVVRTDVDGTMSLRQPTLFLDVSPAGSGASSPQVSDLPGVDTAEAFLIERALTPFLNEVAGERARENQIVREHVEISLRELIDRQQLNLAESGGPPHRCREHFRDWRGTSPKRKHISTNLTLASTAGARNWRWSGTARSVTCSTMGRAWVLPHPERSSPGIAPMVRDAEIERIAVREAIAHEERLGWVVESVETENRGYDLLSKKPHPSEPGVFVSARFIEVKGPRWGWRSRALHPTNTGRRSASGTTTGFTSSSTAAQRRS